MSNIALTGTITATGVVAGSEFSARLFDLRLLFAGVATVRLQVQMPSEDWMTVPDPGDITGNYYETHDSATPKKFRLNCSAYTNDVEWAVEYGDRYEKA